MKVSILGSGNVATILGRKILLAGHTITEVISQNEEHARILAKELNCRYGSGWESVGRDADLYILALPDDVLNSIGKDLGHPKKIVVHTAGSVSKDVLQESAKNFGVLYPLQSLRKELKELPEIPFLVDANTEDGLTILYDFAKTLSMNVQVAGDEKRLKLHLASVIVNNFVNHLYSLAEHYCKSENLDFSWLFPLIEETAGRLRNFSPAAVQTGPAIRKDFLTLEKHLALLEGYPEIKKVYELLTREIQQSHNQI
jgi:predicted short-subunit dehydrogenase-like oxidoreductase (DUF2520 family)